ncbi:SIMPL domain-containing protein [Thalassotalea fusca]
MMKFIKLLLCISLSVTALSSYSADGIEVIGKSSIKLTPDRYEINLAIEERVASASKAKAIVDKKSTLLVSSLKKLGITDSQIESTQLMLTPIYEKPDPRFDHSRVNKKVNSQIKVKTDIELDETPEIVVPYFRVSRTFTVTFTEFSYYDKLLDNAIKIGITNISPLQLSFSDTEEHYQSVLSAAVLNARNKAEQLAKTMNVKLGQLINLRESSYHVPRSYAAVAEMRTGFNSNHGDREISAQVIATFAILP